MLTSSNGRRSSRFSRGNSGVLSSSTNPHHIPSPFQNISKRKNFEFVSFQRSVLKRLGYFGISTTRIIGNGPKPGQNYTLVGNTCIGAFMYLVLHINVTIKATFLTFLVADYFGPIEFLDKIATLDYILCTGLVIIGAWVFLLRYPFYEILENLWKHLNRMYWRLGCPTRIREEMESVQKRILFTHLIIIFGGCTALMIQYFPDPKYCNFTYSAFELETPPLTLLFGLFEFLFMMMAWNGYAGPSTMSMYQGVAISKIIHQLNETLQLLYKDEMKPERIIQPGKGYKFEIKRSIIQPHKTVPDTEYDIKRILDDYKQLMLICNLFNHSVAYKTLFLHICGGSQFVSDVFAATHVLRLPGTGFMDVWFYIWDCMSAGFMLLRVYHFMGMVYDASETFLATLNEYFTFQNPNRLQLRKVARGLRIVSLNVGPCKVTTESVLTVLDTMGNYYVVAALW